VKVTSIVPVEHVIGAGIAVPEKLPIGAETELPQYTFTKSKFCSTLNSEKLSVTGPHVSMSHDSMLSSA